MPSSESDFPDHPVLARVRRGEFVESQHRGAWVLVDGSGAVLDGAGEVEHPFFARSSIKCLQALPLVESGAAERFGYTDAELALALASHNGEDLHTRGVRAVLERLRLTEQHLLCGPEPPRDPDTRAALVCAGREPGAVHNNCSGKHAGFLALALELGVAPERYLDPESESQRTVRDAVLEMTGLTDGQLTSGVDGCSAPTFRMPLVALATAFARVSNPEGLARERRAACERMLAAVAAHPFHIAGRHRRLCSELARLGAGLFPKVGGEAVYAVGVRGADRALAVKIDDGATRALNAVVVGLLRRFGFLEAAASRELAHWIDAPLRNRAGLDVGRLEVLV